MTEEKLKQAIEIKRKLDNVREFKSLMKVNFSYISIQTTGSDNLKAYIDPEYTDQFCDLVNSIIKELEIELNLL